MGVIPPNSVLKVLIDTVLIPHTTSHNPQTQFSLGEAEFQSSILIIILHPICTSSSSIMDFFSIFTLNNTNPLSSQKAGKTPSKSDLRWRKQFQQEKTTCYSY